MEAERIELDELNYPETECCFCGKKICCEYSCNECKLKLIEESKD